MGREKRKPKTARRFFNGPQLVRGPKVGFGRRGWRAQSALEMSPPPPIEGRIFLSILVAFCGLLIGMGSAYLSGNGSAARAARDHVASITMRDGPSAGILAVYDARDEIVERVLGGKKKRPTIYFGTRREERLTTPPLKSASGDHPPRIIIIFDDMGLDHQAFGDVMALPGPLTVSFLPYAPGLQPLADRANLEGDAIMLHLPMEPTGVNDPGPHALQSDMLGTDLLRELDWNLSRFKGYVGVNNHMGSHMTRDEAAMKTILSVINARGLFFLDSLTTSQSVARKSGRSIGAEVYARDVFLDPEAGQETVRKQLGQVERIARETGYAVAICHPRPDTIAVIGPWLTTAPSRGFEIATVKDLAEIERALLAKNVLAAAG